MKKYLAVLLIILIIAIPACSCKVVGNKWIVNDECFGNVIPCDNATYNLGSATEVWNTLYVTNIVGAAAGGGMSDLVDDLTPQLGGDLDLNGHNFDFPSVANISDVKDEDNMASDSATMLATQQSIKKYVDDNAGISDVVDDVTPQLGGDLDLNAKNIDFPSTPNISDCLDEDDMASDSATKLATQQSIKKYVDDHAGGGMSDLIDDLTPQLGGDLDVNQKAIGDGDGDTKIQIEEGVDDDTFRVDVAGTESMKLSSVGILTLAKQSYVDMYNSNAYYQYAPNAVYTKILFDSETADNQGEGDVTVISGTNTNTAANKLIDGGGGLSAAEVGWGVMNVTDSTFALVTNVDSDTQLTLNTNIFPAPSGDDYWVYASRINITEDGLYLIIMQGGIDDIDTSDLWAIYCYKNGTNLTSINHVASQVNELLIIQKMDVVALNAGDYLEMFCWQNQGIPQWIRYTRALTYLVVYKIG